MKLFIVFLLTVLSANQCFGLQCMMAAAGEPGKLTDCDTALTDPMCVKITAADNTTTKMCVATADLKPGYEAGACKAIAEVGMYCVCADGTMTLCHDDAAGGKKPAAGGATDAPTDFASQVAAKSLVVCSIAGILSIKHVSM